MIVIILFMLQTLGLAAMGLYACMNDHKTVGGFLIFAAFLSLHTDGGKESKK